MLGLLGVPANETNLLGNRPRDPTPVTDDDIMERNP